MMEDNIVVVKDTNPEEAKKEYVFNQVNNLLLIGVLVGFVMCICLFGILQQCIDSIDTSDFVRMIVRKFWFDIQWWYWLVPLGLSIVTYYVARNIWQKKFYKEKSQ